jgi:F-type H+-transporting ATPase subunit delta
MGQKHFNISYFKVTSAYKLDHSEMEALRKVIALKFNRKNIIVSNKVDATVIGGIKIQSHSHSIDATIKNKLNLMRESTHALDHNRR